METLIIATIVVFCGLWLTLKIISWMFTGISDWLWLRKVNKENVATQTHKNALDEEAKQHCGDDWIAQMQYKVKKSLYTLREIRAKDYPEEFYRDEKGFLQLVNPPETEEKIKLKTKDFKCPSCGAPIGSVNDKMRGTCCYCSTEVAFLRS